MDEGLQNQGVEIPNEELDGLYQTLCDMLDGKQVEKSMTSPFMTLIMHGLVESEEMKKPCRTCGHPVFDHRYERVTGAGRLFVAAYAAKAPASPGGYNDKS